MGQDMFLVNVMDSNGFLWVLLGLYAPLWILIGFFGSLFALIYASLFVLMGPYRS